MSRRQHHGRFTRPSSEASNVGTDLAEDQTFRRHANVYDAVAGDENLTTNA